MIGIDDIIATFEDERSATVMTKSAGLFDKVCAERGWTDASRLWDCACHEYDRRHMTEDEYEANYGPE